MQSELAPRSLRGAEDEPDADATAAASSAEDSESPFIRRVFSGRRRRRAVTDLSGATRRHPSFRRDVGHAASETYLITRLTLILLRSLGSANRVPAHGDSFMVLDQELCLGYSECINKILDLQVGYRWITKCLALGCYAMLLMPGFLQVAYYYFFSNQVRRSVVYGEQPRNRLDLYLPIDNDGSKPVVAFVTGGAWIIGYKAWGALLGKRLSERGIIVACIDYRNFPQGTISDMVNDVSKGISFVCNNAASFGGDPDRIYLIGQSAGAHIAVCTLFDQVIKECGEGENTGWSTCQIKTYFGLSGGYNVLNLVEHFHSRGLYRSLFLSIMEGEQSLRRFSPELLVQDLSVRHAVSLLPPIILYHGTGDYSIPSAASKDFADALESVGAQVKLLLYEGKTHTDLFLQDPLRGGRDELLEDVISVIRASDSSELVNDFVAPLARRLVPEFILKLASRISPF